MKMEYNEIITMSGINPNGEKVVISKGDEVCIKFDETVELDDWFKGMFAKFIMDNTVKIRVHRITKTGIHCQFLENNSLYLKLRPKQIIEISEI